MQDVCVWTSGTLVRAWKPRRKENWFTFCCGSVSGETGNSSAPGHFYIGSSYLSFLTGETCLGRDSAEHHVVDFIALSTSLFKEPTSNLWRIPRHIQTKACVLNSMQCSITCGPARPRWVLWELFYTALLRSSGTRQSLFLPLLYHYLLIHFTQPGVIMHGPVNGYLSMPRIYLIISKSGGEDKSADCVHCAAFFAGGET